MPPKKRAPPQGPFCCYALEHSTTQRTYTGQTNNFARRIRQHNGQLSGGARYTHRAKKDQAGKWAPIFRVCGFETLRAVLQFEWHMKKRRIKNSARVRGPTGRVRQLEFLLSLGRLNAEPHSHFASNGIYIEVHVSKEGYLKMARLTNEAFNLLRLEQNVVFHFSLNSL